MAGCAKRPGGSPPKPLTGLVLHSLLLRDSKTVMATYPIQSLESKGHGSVGPMHTDWGSDRKSAEDARRCLEDPARRTEEGRLGRLGQTNSRTAAPVTLHSSSQGGTPPDVWPLAVPNERRQKERRCNSSEWASGKQEKDEKTRSAAGGPGRGNVVAAVRRSRQTLWAPPHQPR